MFIILARIISALVNIFILMVIIDSVLSFFMSPYHPLRAALDRIVNPFLNPIRRVIPSLGGLDLSPLILIILVEILSQILVSIIAGL
jgi:YggT family protein